MKEKTKNTIENVRDNFIYDIIKGILLSIFTGGVSYSVIYKTIKSTTLESPYNILISVALTALVLLIVITIYVKKAKTIIPPKKIETDYIIEERDVTFTYGKSQSIYEATIVLKPKKNTRNYYGRFYWSGSGSGNIKTENAGFKLQYLKQRTQYIEYEVTFDKTYKKGEKIKLYLKGEMEDPQGTAATYFASTVSVPTKKLIITIKKKDRSDNLSNLEKEIVKSYSDNHINSERIELDATGKYVWKINNPKVSYQYSINWSPK